MRAAQFEPLTKVITADDLPQALFKGVGEEIKEALLPHCQWFWAAKGYEFYGHTSLQNEFLHFVTDGKIKSEYLAADDKKYALSYFGKGDMFGELENLDPGPFHLGNPNYPWPYRNAAIVTALEDSEVIRIRWEDFKKYGLKNDKQLILTENLLHFFAKRIWTKLIDTVVVRSQPADEKLRERLRDVYDGSRPTKRTKDGRHVIHIGLAELLGDTGLGRSRFYQLKEKFKDQFTFDARKGELVILQPEWLEAL